MHSLAVVFFAGVTLISLIEKPVHGVSLEQFTERTGYAWLEAVLYVIIESTD